MKQFRHVDTQVVSYAYKGIPGFTIAGAGLSSVAAKEFLGAYGDSLTQDRYYVPSSIHWLTAAHRWPQRYDPIRRNRPYSKMVTDRLTLDFRHELPSIVEYGSVAFSTTINAKNSELMQLALSHLPKQQQRAIRKRFEFLCENEVFCVPITPEAVQRAYQILAMFLERHQPKANLRNTLNDMLILSAAAQDKRRLDTFDGLLGRIAGGLFAGRRAVDGRVLTLDFSTAQCSDQQGSCESKRYINRSWMVFERRGRDPQR